MTFVHIFLVVRVLVGTAQWPVMNLDVVYKPVFFDLRLMFQSAVSECGTVKYPPNLCLFEVDSLFFFLFFPASLLSRYWLNNSENIAVSFNFH